MHVDDAIAKECDKLYGILNSGLEELSNTHTLQGKKWYGLGLESDDTNNKKDTAAKKNIILRMIDRLVDMIKAIGSKIAEWYRKCKAAISKFFSKKEPNPKDIEDRFNRLIKDITDDHISRVIANLSERSKNALAGIAYKQYFSELEALYADYSKIDSTGRNVKEFISKQDFFNEYVSKFAKFRETTKVVEDTADKLIETLLKGNSGKVIANSTDLFIDIDKQQGKIDKTLQQLLKDIPENTDEAEQRVLVKLVADVINTNSKLALTINSITYAITEVMVVLVKSKFKNILFIPH